MLIKFFARHSHKVIRRLPKFIPKFALLKMHLNCSFFYDRSTTLHTSLMICLNKN